MKFPLEIQRPDKKLFAIEKDGQVHVLADCRVRDGMIRIKMSHEQFELWYNRKKIVSEIFPELPQPVQEVLISGLTPPEWRDAYNLSRPFIKQYTRAELLAFGYEFES